MLKGLLGFFLPESPLKEMGENFAQMLSTACEMSVDAGKIFFDRQVTPEARTQLYKRDVQVNRLERRIRKQVVTHLSLSNTSSLPYCLLLMSLVKDVERIGDYAKNLSEVVDIYPGVLPDDENVAELREIREGVETAMRATLVLFESEDRERALSLIREGQDLAQRCEGVVMRVARSEYDAGLATATVLAARYYKRFGGHVLNILSSIVMPLHKVDYYDEKEVPGSKEPS